MSEAKRKAIAKRGQAAMRRKLEVKKLKEKNNAELDRQNI